MNCCNLQIPYFVHEPSVNEKLLTGIMQLPDGLRKVVRLLAKQYEILEIYQEPPIMHSHLIIKEQPHIIIYKHFGSGSEEFEFIIYVNRMH